jgi:hypothetical protein
MYLLTLNWTYLGTRMYNNPIGVVHLYQVQSPRISTVVKNTTKVIE